MLLKYKGFSIESNKYDDRSIDNLIRLDETKLVSFGLQQLVSIKIYYLKKSVKNTDYIFKKLLKKTNYEF